MPAKLLKRINFLYHPLHKTPLFRLLPIALQKTVALLISISIILGAPGMLYLFNPFTQEVKAAWFDDSWKYRQRIDVTNGSGSTQTDYQVYFTLDTATLVTAGKMQSDCDDIRITDINGKLQPYWIEKLASSACNTSTTKIWTKAASIPTSGISMYVYYGNSSAAIYQSGKSTFPYFDDFSASSLDTSMWTISDPAATIGVSGGKLVFSPGNSAWNQAVYLTSAIARSDMAMEFDYQWTSNNASYDAFMMGWDTAAGSSYTNLTYAYYNQSSDTCTTCSTYIYEDGTSRGTGTGSWVQNTNYKVQLRMRNSGGAYYNQSTDGGINYTTSYTSTYSTASNLHPGWALYAGTHNIDNFFVRKDAATPPTTSVNATVEKTTGPVAYWKMDEGVGSTTKDSFSTTNNAGNNSIPALFGSNGKAMTTLPDTTSTSCSGSNRLLMVSITEWRANSTSSISSVTNTTTSTTLTKLGQGFNTGLASIYYMVAPASGSNTISVAGTNDAFAVNAHCFNNVNQTTPLGSMFTDIATAQPTITATSTVTGSMLYATLAVLCSETPTDDGTISGGRTQSACNAKNITAFKNVTSSSTSLSWTGLSDTRHALLAVEMKGVTGAFPTWKTGDQCISGNCLYFDGNGTQAITTSSVMPTGSNASSDMSISLWLRPMSTNTGAHQLIAIQQATTTEAAGEFALWFVSDGRLFFDRFDGGADRADEVQMSAVNVASLIPNNRWSHIVVTWTGGDNGTGAIYVNGTAATVTNASNQSTGNWAVGTGTVFGAGAAGTTAVKAVMDEVKLYNYALSSSQVKLNFNAVADREGVASKLGINRDNLGGALSNGLVGYWKMDESSGNATDYSGNSYTLTNNNTATFAPGKFGNAGSLTAASSQSFSCTDAACGGTNALDTTTGFTAAAWVNSSAVTTNYQQIIAKSDGSATTNAAYELRFNGTTGGIQFVGNINGSYTGPSSSTILSNNTWYHIAAVYDGSYMRIYINGVQDGTPIAASGSMSNSTANFYIGRRADGFYFNGKIDDARVYNRALTASEISSLYNWAARPAFYAPMDEGSGTTTTDTIGGLTAGFPNSFSWGTGKYGKATSYNSATAQYADFGNSFGNYSSTQPFTVEAWVNPTSLTGADVGIVSRDDSSCAGWSIRISSANKFRFIFASNGSNYRGSDTTTSLTAGVWQHVGAVWDGSSVTTYINGVREFNAVNSGTLGTTTSSSNTLRFAHFNCGGGGFLNGGTDEVRIYNYARTSGQIVEDMNGGHPIGGSPVGSPAAWWKFNEGYSITAHNSGAGGSSYDGTLSGATTPSWSDAGKLGKALSFNGSTAYIAAGSALGITPYLTISLWMYPTANSTMVLVSKTNAAASSRNYQVATIAGGEIQFCPSAGSCTSSSGYSWSTSTWTHLVVTYDGATIKYYKNGTLANSQANTTGLTSTTDVLNIGSYGSGAGGFFTGKLDDVKIYDATLTADQVKLDYNQNATQVLGATSDKTGSGYEGGNNAANQEYCIPGSTATCTTPVGRWDFEEGTGTSTYDSSGGGTTGTLTNTPTWNSGKNGKGIKFTGSSSQYVDFGTSLANYASSQPFTVEMWIYPTSLGGTDQGLFSRENASFVGWHTRITTANKFRFLISSSGANYRGSDTVALTANTWQHVVGVWDGTTATTYLNGKLDTTAVNGGTLGTTTLSTNLYAARDLGTATYFTGSMDGIRIFDYARSAAQVAWDYNKGAPVAWWKLDECQGTSLGDSSGNGNTATITIGTGAGTGHVDSVGTCSTASTAWGNGANGKINSSLSFDGIDDYASTPYSSSLNLSYLTLAAWIKINYTSGNLQIISRDASDRVWQFRIEGGGLIRLIVFDTGGSNYQCLGVTNVGNNIWHHVAGTWDGSTEKVYVDGKLDNSCNTTTGTLKQGTTSSVDIGTSLGVSGYFVGQIDDARVYNYPLTQKQIQLLLNNGGGANFAPITGTP